MEAAGAGLAGWVLGNAFAPTIISATPSTANPVGLTGPAGDIFKIMAQRGVDQRFNRARYDADKTVAAFAVGLKDAVDLDTVQADLASAVQQALEPAHVSIWLAERH